ncbi:hypothetical protein [Halocatena halophila]|uniref:hypothetical protein n=1 Tax=Halocatena halophila TaxID=2814576 RepID=UPI002ED623B5
MAEEDNDDGTSSINRRTILKALGTTAAVGVTGVGLGTSAATEDKPTVARKEVSVSEAEVQKVLDRKETRVTLENAPVSSFDWNSTTGYEIRVEANGDTHEFREVTTDSDHGDALFSYVMGGDSPNSATVKAGSETIFRARAIEGDIQTEEIKLGNMVTDDALRTLDSNGTLSKIKSKVSTLKTEKASGYVDRTSGTTHLYLPAKMDGEEVWLYAEMDASGGSDAVYVMQQGAIECFIGCVLAQGASIGRICYNTICLPCRAALTVPTCAPCAGCAGAIGANCAVGCGAEFLL